MCYTLPIENVRFDVYALTSLLHIIATNRSKMRSLVHRRSAYSLVIRFTRRFFLINDGD